MPEVVGALGLGIGSLDQVGAGHRREQLQVRRARCMPSGDETADDACRVLFAEDEPRTRVAVQRLLERSGAEVTAVDSAAEAMVAFTARLADGTGRSDEPGEHEGPGPSHQSTASGGYDVTHGTQIVGLLPDGRAPFVWTEGTSPASLTTDIGKILEDKVPGL